MLERVPQEAVAELSKRSAMDFDTPHSRNRRAMPLPLDDNAATYAVDDLHRLEIILRSQTPRSGNYFDARNQTNAFTCRMLHDAAGTSAEKMQQLQSSLQRCKTDVQKLTIAVRVKRHMLALRILGHASSQMTTLEQQA